MAVGRVSKLQEGSQKQQERTHKRQGGPQSGERPLEKFPVWWCYRSCSMIFLTVTQAPRHTKYLCTELARVKSPAQKSPGFIKFVFRCIDFWVLENKDLTMMEKSRGGRNTGIL